MSQHVWFEHGGIQVCEECLTLYGWAKPGEECPGMSPEREEWFWRAYYMGPVVREKWRYCIERTLARRGRDVVG